MLSRLSGCAGPALGCEASSPSVSPAGGTACSLYLQCRSFPHSAVGVICPGGGWHSEDWAGGCFPITAIDWEKCRVGWLVSLKGGTVLEGHCLCRHPQLPESFLLCAAVTRTGGPRPSSGSEASSELFVYLLRPTQQPLVLTSFTLPFFPSCLACTVYSDGVDNGCSAPDSGSDSDSDSKSISSESYSLVVAAGGVCGVQLHSVPLDQGFARPPAAPVLLLQSFHIAMSAFCQTTRGLLAVVDMSGNLGIWKVSMCGSICIYFLDVVDFCSPNYTDARLTTIVALSIAARLPNDGRTTRQLQQVPVAG